MYTPTKETNKRPRTTIEEIGVFEPMKNRTVPRNTRLSPIADNNNEISGKGLFFIVRLRKVLML